MHKISKYSSSVSHKKVTTVINVLLINVYAKKVYL